MIFNAFCKISLLNLRMATVSAYDVGKNAQYIKMIGGKSSQRMQGRVRGGTASSLRTAPGDALVENRALDQPQMEH